MADFYDISCDLLELASDLGRMATGAAAAPGEAAARLERVAGRLRGHEDTAFGAGLETELVRSGVAAARAALELETAVRAIADIGVRPTAAGPMLARMAHLQCIAALGLLARQAAPAGDLASQVVCEGAGAARTRGAVSGSVPSGAANVPVLMHISHFHRQHARFHAQHKYEHALEIAREAHKVKALADLWLAGGGPQPVAGVDYADPRYRAAPCTDLNVPAAIPYIGFLFLEGAGEPPEIALLKARLDALANEIGDFGNNLMRAMDAAWVRESALFAPDRIAIAWTRLQVVFSNWRASQDSILAARLLTMSRENLQEIDFTPAGARARMAEAGARLAAVGRIMDIAAQLCAAAGGALADNNWRYTQYSDYLERATG